MGDSKAGKVGGEHGRYPKGSAIVRKTEQRNRKQHGTIEILN